MKLTSYTFPAPTEHEVTVALVCDLHDRPPEAVLSALSEIKPDIIAVAGDLIIGKKTGISSGISFLERAVKIAPVCYSAGNHEHALNRRDISAIRKTGAYFLENASVTLCGIKVGGLSSAFFGKNAGQLKLPPVPKLQWLDRFSHEDGYKLLLCHHPEYYAPYIKKLNIDLVLSGHAHGGQIRLFGRGIFAPGQGFFPKYTRGVYDGRLIISAGLANTAHAVPRVFNETELVIIKLAPE